MWDFEILCSAENSPRGRDCVAPALLQLFLWEEEFWFHYMHFPGEQMGRYWSISMSRRLTFSSVISSQLDLTLKEQKRKLGWYWALQQPFSAMENVLDICTDYITLSLSFFLCVHFLIFDVSVRHLQGKTPVLWETWGKAAAANSGEGRGHNS